MSNYTITLGKIIDSYPQNVNTNRIKRIEYFVENALTEPYFNFTTENPIDKKRFLKLFCQHYYVCEIGFETPEMFFFQMDVRLQELVDKYNKLWELSREGLNIYYNTDNITIQHLGHMKKEEENILDGQTTGNVHNVGSSIEDNEKLQATTDNVTKNINVNDKEILDKDTKETIKKDEDEEKHWTEQDNDSVGTEYEMNGTNSTLNSDLPQVSWTPVADYGSDMSRGKVNQSSTTNVTDHMQKGGDHTVAFNANNSNTGTENSTKTIDTTTKDIVNGSSSLKESGNKNNTTDNTIDNTEKITNTENITGNTEEDYIQTRTGYSNVNPMKELIANYRNVDLMFIEECADLFMLIW